MEIKLDPNQGYVKNDLFDQKEALKSIGVKAAVCFKETKDNKVVSPSDIRAEETDTKLITRAISTILSDHTSPSEQQIISLEITGIPKKLCMILNNEHQYSADERSLRYTAVEENELITTNQVILYNKWLKIFEDIIIKEYYDFYRRFYKTDKGCLNAIHKLAQENARYIVSIDMPTTITYTVPLAQINKIALYMERIINKPLNSFEESLIPLLKEFIKGLKDKKVLITKKDIYELSKTNEELYQALIKLMPDLDSYSNDDRLLYQNNKDIDLSLFANRNKFSTIDYPSKASINGISYNNYESFACLAQEQRHRTIDCEMKIPENPRFFIPPIIAANDSLVRTWITDISSVAMYLPQGTLIKVNRQASLANIFDYVAKERACDRAQLEIEQVYTKEIIPFIYQELINDGQEEMAQSVKPYLNNLRCAFKDYHCPSPCHHPRLERKL